MNVPVYQVGDLVILKPHCWKNMPKYENSVGLITGLGAHSFSDPNLKSFFVRFENLTFIRDNTRIIWVDDILQHYPVVK